MLKKMQLWGSDFILKLFYLQLMVRHSKFLECTKICTQLFFGVNLLTQHG